MVTASKTFFEAECAGSRHKMGGGSHWRPSSEEIWGQEDLKAAPSGFHLPTGVGRRTGGGFFTSRRQKKRKKMINVFKRFKDCDFLKTNKEVNPFNINQSYQDSDMTDLDL